MRIGSGKHETSGQSVQGVAVAAEVHTMGDNSGVDRMYQLVAPRTLPCDDANIEIQYSTRFWIMPNAVTQDRFGSVNEEQGVIVGHAGEQILGA